MLVESRFTARGLVDHIDNFAVSMRSDKYVEVVAVLAGCSF